MGEALIARLGIEVVEELRAWASSHMRRSDLDHQQVNHDYVSRLVVLEHRKNELEEGR